MKSLSDFPSISETTEWLESAIELAHGRDYSSKVTVKNIHKFGLKFYVNVPDDQPLSIDGMSFLHGVDKSEIPQTVSSLYDIKSKLPIKNHIPLILKEEFLSRYEGEDIGSAIAGNRDELCWFMKRLFTQKGVRFSEVVLESEIAVYPSHSSELFGDSRSYVYCVKEEVEKIAHNFKKLYDAFNPKKEKPVPNDHYVDRWAYYETEETPQKPKDQSADKIEESNEMHLPEKRELVLKDWLIGGGYGLNHEFKDKKRLDVWNALHDAEPQLFPKREKVDSTINNFFTAAKLCSFKKGR